ncbi:MAG: ImmA/IrrE family metallo-endopeptidase [Hyphomicrobiales bacterium]|nr:ImmA/IrrE family metallo-endopeptidase [Hyphomicrobiales bacterium]
MDDKEIEKKADELTERYLEPPVPVYGIARENKVEVYTADFGEFSNRFSGFFDFENADIYLNEKDAIEKQYFTTAHEFGHWILHKDDYIADPERYAFMSKRTETANGNSDDYMEREADYFATCLLMPRLLVKKFVPYHSSSELAAMFNVPHALMENRLKEVL